MLQLIRTLKCGPSPSADSCQIDHLLRHSVHFNIPVLCPQEHLAPGKMPKLLVSYAEPRSLILLINNSTDALTSPCRAFPDLPLQTAYRICTWIPVLRPLRWNHEAQNLQGDCTASTNGFDRAVIREQALCAIYIQLIWSHLCLTQFLGPANLAPLVPLYIAYMFNPLFITLTEIRPHESIFKIRSMSLYIVLPVVLKSSNFPAPLPESIWTLPVIRKIWRGIVPPLAKYRMIKIAKRETKTWTTRDVRKGTIRHG